MMESMSASSWQRKGSSIVFDSACIGELIAQAAPILSLRQFLACASNALDRLPDSGPVLVSGLEAVVESMEPLAVVDFLSSRVRPLLIRLQNVDCRCGVVFGFNAHAKAFQTDGLKEELTFLTSRDTTVRLSEGLWGGSVSVGMKCLVRDSGREELIGYHVARIS